MKFKFMSRILWAVLAGLFLVSCSLSPQAEEDNTLKMALIPVLDVLPFYVAQEQGYFDAEGIITRIVVKHALSCDRPYEGQLERMTCLNNAPIST